MPARLVPHQGRDVLANKQQCSGAGARPAAAASAELAAVCWPAFPTSAKAAGAPHGPCPLKRRGSRLASAATTAYKAALQQACGASLPARPPTASRAGLLEKSGRHTRLLLRDCCPTRPGCQPGSFIPDCGRPAARVSDRGGVLGMASYPQLRLHSATEPAMLPLRSAAVARPAQSFVGDRDVAPRKQGPPLPAAPSPSPFFLPPASLRQRCVVCPASDSPCSRRRQHALQQGRSPRMPARPSEAARAGLRLGVAGCVELLHCCTV